MYICKADAKAKAGDSMLLYTVWPVIVAGVSVIMDVKNARIDNGWILFSVCVGLYFKIYKGGFPAVISFAVGMMTPLALLGILFYFRMLGPGDIKLLCALGGVMGSREIVCCIIASFLMGAVMSMAILIFYGNVSQRIQYLYQYLQEYLHTGIRKPYYKKGMPLENIHFTVPVFLSVVLYTGGVF